MAWTVFAKEWRDALRDRRTLAVVLLGSVAMGPLVLVLMSLLVGEFERRAEARELRLRGLELAPTLVNHLQRQGFRVLPAPEDFERALAENRLADPVLVLPPEFEADLAAARSPLVEVVYASSNKRAAAGVSRALQLLVGFNREQATLRLALRGVSPLLLEAVQAEPRDLSETAARGAQLSAVIPFFLLLAVLYGALNAALDSTAGERERASLEPLLMTPAPRAAIVLGKWAAVTAVAMLIALLACASFLPGQWLLRSEALAALFRFGGYEALLFLALLLPLAAALSAVLMWVAIRCRSVKEAQANASLVVLLVSLLPVLTWFDLDAERRWSPWVPGLGQTLAMGRVLQGQPLAAVDLLPPLLVCLVLTALAVAAVTRSLARHALST